MNFWIPLLYPLPRGFHAHVKQTLIVLVMQYSTKVFLMHCQKITEFGIYFLARRPLVL